MNERKIYERVKWLRQKSYCETLSEGLSSMFVRTGLPEDFRGVEGLIEEILLANGCGAYVYRDDFVEKKWIFGKCETTGEPGSYGFGKNCIVTAGGGYCKEFLEWETNPDIVVVWNNPIRTRDYNVARFSDLLAETETSLISQLMNSRLHPIPIANDEKNRVAIDTALADMDAGKLRTILSPNVFKDLIEAGVDPRVVEVLNLTDPSASDHIQYISKLRDDLIRWFWQLYGHNSESNGKLAQQTVEEVSSGQSISMIIPLTRYQERQREAENLKRKFGWDVTIEFSDAWATSFARIDDIPAEPTEEGESANDESINGNIDPETNNEESDEV